MTRDFSIYEPEEGDTEDDLTKKAAGMALLEDIMDYYTEKLMPACAGAKLFNTKIRHFDSMSEVLMPNGGEGQLRITAGTEAFAMLTYMNKKDKWEATFDWHAKNPNTTTKCPRYSKTKPKENENSRPNIRTPRQEPPTGEVGVVLVERIVTVLDARVNKQ